MKNLDEDALICDLAETYNIYDYKSLPCSKVATFSCGLRNDSRIKQKIAGLDVKQSDLFLAAIFDNTSVIAWMLSADGSRGSNRPKSMVNKLLGIEETGNEDVMTFDSGEEFHKEWNRLTKGGL